MADYSDYYSTIARAISGLPGKTEEARGAVYELARAALQKRLSAFDPPVSETDLAIERFALEAAIQRVERELRFSDTRHGLSLLSTLTQFVGSLRDKLDDNITASGGSLKEAVTPCLAQRLRPLRQSHRLRCNSRAKRRGRLVQDEIPRGGRQ